MRGFIEENIIFVVSSLLLVGLFIGVTEFKNISSQDQNQVNISQIPITDASNTIATVPEAVSNPTSQSTPTTPAQVSNPTSTPTVTPIPVPTPTAPPVITPFQPRFGDDERDN